MKFYFRHNDNNDAINNGNINKILTQIYEILKSIEVAINNSEGMNTVMPHMNQLYNTQFDYTFNCSLSLCYPCFFESVENEKRKT